MSEKTHGYWLPSQDGTREDHETESNSVVIIGANGSGKSKLGAWMEQQDFERVHRIASQRNLNFSEHIPLQSYAEAEGTVFYGSAEPSHQRQKGVRWNWSKSYTTTLLNDFDPVLAALIAKYGNEAQNYFEAARAAEKAGTDKPQTQDSTLDKLYAIWESVFPQREIKMADASFLAVMPETRAEYPAPEMSDGERAVLYLAAQVLCMPEEKILIVDEPEIHLHYSLIARLWRALEQARPDCLFVYITHDIQFATEHAHSDIVWVKAYDGHRWDWSIVPDSDLPEELVISLAGNRKPVLFVEGKKSSLDLRLYTLLYPDFHVVPCGSCEEVIRNTKAYSATEGLNNIRAYGIVDRDYRSDEQLAALKTSGVHALGVAEVENLLLTEPFVTAMAERFLITDPKAAFSRIRDYVIEQRFKPQLDKQINAATISALKATLTGVDIMPTNGNPLDKGFEDAINAISPATVLTEQKQRFEDAANNGDYEGILAIFNDKSLVKSIGHFLGIDDKLYCDRACQMLTSDSGGALRTSLSKYIPMLNPV